MKKNFLYLFAVLCTLSFFTACGDDDDPTPNPTPDPDPTPEQPTVLDVNAAYSAATLDLTYSDSPLLGKEVTFKTEDGKTATITMVGTFDMSIIGGLLSSKATAATPSMAPGVIPGEVSTTLSNVALTLSGEKYTFEGEYTGQSGVKATYSGEVTKGKLTMGIKATMPANDLVGTWALAPFAPTAEPASMPLLLNWESTTPITIPGALVGAPVETVTLSMNDLLGALNTTMISPKLGGVLESITYQEDGNIVASYKKAGSEDFETSPLNLAQYYVKDGKMFVLLNIDQIMATVAANQTKAGIGDIIGIITPFLSYLSEGVPLDLTVANGVAQVKAGKDLLLPMLSLLTNETVSGLLTKLIPESMQPMLPAIQAQLPGILETTSDVSSTLILVKQQ